MPQQNNSKMFPRSYSSPFSAVEKLETLVYEKKDWNGKNFFSLKTAASWELTFTLLKNIDVNIP